MARQEDDIPRIHIVSQPDNPASHPDNLDSVPPESHQSTSSSDSTGLKRVDFTRRNQTFERFKHISQKIIQHRWFAWIPAKLTWPALKPVIRAAVAAWLGLVIQLIVPAERALGYAAFFVLVVAFMIPPWQPVVQNFEVLVNLYFFNAIAWAWLALGVFLAGLARSPVNPAKIARAEAKWAHLRGDPSVFRLHMIYDATYVEAKSAIVCAMFLCVGTGAFLWYKLRTQPSPATFPLVLSCILMDIGFTTAALYPYPLYTSGLLFFLPMAVQGGLAALCSVVIFPESVSHSFQGKLVNVIRPLAFALAQMEDLFSDSSANASSLSFDTEDDKLHAFADKSKAIRKELLKSLSGVPPLRAQQRYLKVDISYGRLSSSDLRDLFDRIATVQTRSGGLAFFFDIIVMNAKHLHLDSSAFSVHDPSQSRPASRPQSIREISDMPHETPSEPEHDDPPQRKLHFPAFMHRRSGSPHGIPVRHSHVSLIDSLRKSQQPVGLYESQRYMDVERAFSNDTDHILEQLSLLSSAASPLIAQCKLALSTAVTWLEKCDHKARVKREQTPSLEEVIGTLQGALDDFYSARLVAIKPYRHIFDPAHPPSDDFDYRKLKHRGLFQVFVAHYHLIEFSESLLRMLRMLDDLDRARQRHKLWYPRLSVFLGHIRSSHIEARHLTDGGENEDEDGDFAHHEEDDVLGEAKKRNPDHVPFENAGLNVLSRLSALPNILRSRSFTYAVKAAVLTALTTLPQFIASSAAFYYYNRGIWCAIMAQLTLAMYSGDTTAAWLGRCVASFWGAVFGMVVWYIGSGSGKGNPYGLAAACAVTFPIALFFRIHFPGPVLTAVMTPVTFGLIIGYSYLNGTVVQLTSATWGFDVAWRRFVCVLIGITAAFIFSYIPPVYSAKTAIRQSYAASISASGSILSEIITHANDHHYHLTEHFESRQRLLAWRSKLNKLGARHANAQYEYSLSGRWPEERYKALLETLQDLFSLLSQLNHVSSQLEKPWRRALLDRTRLNDPAFIGDVLAVITMCATCLRSAHPLPQVTPSPLVARFRMGKIKGLEISHEGFDSAGELPALVTVDVLESEHYMRYALGVTTTFSIMSRLDRLVVICKTGELSCQRLAVGRPASMKCSNQSSEARTRTAFEYELLETILGPYWAPTVSAATHVLLSLLCRTLFVVGARLSNGIGGPACPSRAFRHSANFGSIASIKDTA